jgi:hypothetical protein
MFVLHARQRIVFPRAACGTASTFLQVRLGHMIRIVPFELMCELLPHGCIGTFGSGIEPL